MIKIIDGDITYEISGYKEERIREALRVTLFPKRPATPTPSKVELPERTPPIGYRFLRKDETTQWRDMGFNHNNGNWDAVSRLDIGIYPAEKAFVRKI